MKTGGSTIMKKQKLLILLLLAASPFVLTGCLAAAAVGGAAAAGAGTVAYIKGELKATEDASLNKTWSATVAAIDDLQFLVTNKLKDDVSAELDAKTADNKTVKIQLKRVTGSLTDISIRIGTFGDESLSRYILSKIEARL
jgi:predicted small secreted protein